MRVRVRYFASLREALGADDVVELAAGATLRTLRDALLARGGEHAARLARERAVRFAIDQQVATDEDAPLREGSEVAFFPPVTGG